MTLPAESLRALQDRSSGGEAAHALASTAHLAVIALCLVASRHGWWPAVVLCWPLIAWLHHAALVRLHEAVHGLLSRSRWRNELWGVAIGTLSLVPMSVYRHVHRRHHAHLGGVRDPEFWPYNLPGSSRALRCGYAWAELLLGAVVTPWLYSLRTARAWATHPAALRRRLVLEWLLLVAFWGGVLAAVAGAGWWAPFTVAVLVPAWLTGVLQTLRKFTEHLGLAGDTILTTTRSVVCRGRLGRLLSRSQLHVDLHAVHHRWPRIPWQNLPAAAALVRAHGAPAAWFDRHLAALRDMLPHLRDPRVGRQWLAVGRGDGLRRAPLGAAQRRSSSGSGSVSAATSTSCRCPSTTST